MTTQDYIIIFLSLFFIISGFILFTKATRDKKSQDLDKKTGGDGILLAGESFFIVGISILCYMLYDYINTNKTIKK